MFQLFKAAGGHRELREFFLVLVTKLGTVAKGLPLQSSTSNILKHVVGKFQKCLDVGQKMCGKHVRRQFPSRSTPLRYFSPL